MTWPREGSRDIHDGIIVSQVPDICLTPQGAAMVPVPYTIWCRQADAANLADSIRQTDDRTHARESLVLRCYGDEPGTGGGIASGTTGAECTPKTWSASVFVEGRNMVRHDDEWWMNHRNTYGKLVYMKDMEHAEVPEPSLIVAAMGANPAGSLPAQADAPTSFKAPRASLGAGGLVVPAAEGLGAAAMWAARRAAAAAAAAGLGALLGSRTSRKPDKCPCIVLTYSQMRGVCRNVCKDGEAHHIVSDFTKRYGTRPEGERSVHRIRGLPTYYSGASICVTGGAGTPGTQHNVIQNNTDRAIGRLGGGRPDNAMMPLGTAPISEIRKEAVREAIGVRPECAEEIRAGVAKEFAATRPYILGKTFDNPNEAPSPLTIPTLRDQTIH